MGKRVWADVGVAVLAALVGAGLALERAGSWDVSSTVVVVLVVAAAVLAVASTTVHAVAGVRARRLGARRDLLDELLRAATWAVVDRTGLDARDLAPAVYELVPARLGRPARLVRAHRVRAGARPVSSEVRWAPGKGVIGRCVATGDVVAVDLAAWEAGWEGYPVANRGGLSPTEFARLRGKYSVVVAVPMVDDTGASSRVTGCVALDGPPGSLAALSDATVTGILAATGRALQGVSGTARARLAGSGGPGEASLRAALVRQGASEAWTRGVR